MESIIGRLELYVQSTYNENTSSAVPIHRTSSEYGVDSEDVTRSYPSISALNTFKGSVTQQATSVVTSTDPNCYEGETGCFSVYGFEYQPGFEDGVSSPSGVFLDVPELTPSSAVHHMGIQ